MNTTELLIWSRLRGRKVDGWKFRRQQPIGPYFVDFYCPAAKLIVEIDEPAHQGDATWAYDLRRQAWLETEGHRMLRISVSQISRDLNEVIETIYVVLLEQEKRGFFRRPHRPAPPATSPRAGEELASLAPSPPFGPPLLGGEELSPNYFGSSLIEAELMQ